MSWSLSQFRSGDLVEVRSIQEILATLDHQGCVDGMPFMPEMLQFCGHRFRVSAVAHKTCDTVHKTGGRRLNSTVHLAGLRCDGSAHGRCQAECNLFWKDVWLKPASDNRNRAVIPAGETWKAHECEYMETRLLANTFLSSSMETAEPRYSCQATKLFHATEPLPWWDIRQYVFDVITGNHSGCRVLRVLCLACLKQLLVYVPLGYRLFDLFQDWLHRLLTGRASPSICGKIARGAPTPTARLNLSPGEVVRIKSKDEIEQTLDDCGKNRGLFFDWEMIPFCKKVFKVRSRVSRIIDDSTGRMLHMKQPCIVLERVVCNSECHLGRLNCPRAIPAYWREIWLERVISNRQ